MVEPSISFADSFDNNFRKRIKELPRKFVHKEIPLFRAMHSALSGLSGQFQIEEYHGGRHQVTFHGNGSFARSQARCELSDLMVLTYSPTTQEARLCYLQAKAERASLPAVYGRGFSANLEQWFLLSSRPLIRGAGLFNPPADLLSGALLPSVGCFVFFYCDFAGDCQTYYAAANYLMPPCIYSQRYGKLRARGPCAMTTTAGYPECLAARDNKSFAQSLYRLEIGTPVHPKVEQSQSTRNWLAENLRGLIQKARDTEKPAVLAEELLDLLEPESQTIRTGAFGARSLLIIKSEAEPNRAITES